MGTRVKTNKRSTIGIIEYNEEIIITFRGKASKCNKRINAKNSTTQRTRREAGVSKSEPELPRHKTQNMKPKETDTHT
jgi:hypothetical protein